MLSLKQSVFLYWVVDYEEDMIKRYLKRHWRGGVTLGSALIVALVLLLAAYGKIFYPAQALEGFDRTVGVLEFVLLGFLLLFRNASLMWLFASVVFASWGGYALFWHLLSIPCCCMGGALHIPSFVSLSIDGLFWVLSLTMARVAGATKRQLMGSLLIGIVAVVLGFFVAEIVHKHWMAA